ncbi:major facilitator superfamily transporter [Thelonectria olida]|uniref:Major facilitator superfamily transporter n=1 Tax=Thelonectria olida TaxID=1576542 RepID=A0A9P9ANK4_9HYPO|nr:major facilitator superfamily transporter [Thelonectria olida]
MSRDSHQFYELSDRPATRQNVYTPASTTESTVHAVTPDPTADNTDDDAEKHPEYASGFRLAAVTTGLVLAAFCLGLDRSIISTAIPKITSEFDSLDDVAWYGSAFLLTTCCFQLMFGKLYIEYNATFIFLFALLVFEVGSIVCAAAPSSLALIVGRAVAGIGCAGITSGALIIIARILPLEKRPMFTGAIGACSGVAQIVAPTLGGVFTDRLTWRWCFWINLPLGAVTAITVFLFVKLPNRPKGAVPNTFRTIISKLDLFGSFFLIPYLICLLLALQWGGTTYAWSNWRVILCLCLFAVLLLAWLYVQHTKGDNATMSFRIVRQRSVASGMMFSMCLSSVMFVVSYYVPIWFQTVKGVSAEKSGIDFFAAFAPMAVTAVLSGVLTSRIGYYVPQMFISTVLCSISSGLIYRYNLDTSTAYWAGSLAMFGVGIGSGLQMPMIAVQTVLKGDDISIGTSLVVLTQALSGSIFLAVGQNLFQARLVKELTTKVPQVDAKVVMASGAADLQKTMTKLYGEQLMRAIVEAYNTALRRCFLVCVILSCMTIMGALGMEWKSVKADENAKGGAKSAPTKEPEANV